MKSKRGFVTISLVLWLSLILSIVSSLYMMALRQYNIENKVDKVKNYKKYEAYYDVIREFERIINTKLSSGELDFIDIKNESYFLETVTRQYQVCKDEKNDYFCFKVVEKNGEEVFKQYYNQISKEDGSIFFIRRTVGD